ncbi:MAG TPA: cupredoxin domain-containing protein [Acidimicrobiales bacterium]|jgi:plastocyanin|nr:cupredoxin domain-containing protein [Acidimicrobiales bacterium]
MTRSTTPVLQRAGRPAAAALLLAGLGLAACGSDDSSDATNATNATSSTVSAGASDDGYRSPGGTADAGAAATVVAKAFKLTSTTAAAGAEVTFDNQDGTAHTLTADDGAFDTGPVAPGESATLSAPSEPGTYAFHCEIHPSMTGQLTVEG